VTAGADAGGSAAGDRSSLRAGVVASDPVESVIEFVSARNTPDDGA
jgi:hypothetical protein